MRSSSSAASSTRPGTAWSKGSPAGRFEGTRPAAGHGMEEKPERPRSQWAATAVYAFSPRLFEALRTVRSGRDHPKELEVTDAIRELIANGGRVAALVLRPSEPESGVRSVRPDGFLQALKRTQSIARRRAGRRRHYVRTRGRTIKGVFAPC